MIIIGTVIALSMKLANYLNQRPQSNNILVVMGTRDFFITTIAIIMWKVPVLKPHASVVSSTLYSLSAAIFYNLAIRNVLPYPVAETHLDFFSSYLETSFIWVNCLLLHDFKWLLFFHGPIFLAAIYFEALQAHSNESQGDPNYGEGSI